MPYAYEYAWWGTRDWGLTLTGILCTLVDWIFGENYG